MKDPSFSDSWFMFGDIQPLAENTITRHKDKNCKEAGVNIVAVSKRLGHKDIGITLNTYTHLLEKNNEEMIDRLEESSHDLLTNLLTAEFRSI